MSDIASVRQQTNIRKEDNWRGALREANQGPSPFQRSQAMKREYENNVDFPEEVFDQIFEKIKEGYTSGKIEDGNGLTVSWSFDYESWREL